MSGMIENNFRDMFTESALPNIDKSYIDTYDLYPDVIPHIFDVKSSDRDIEQQTGVTNFGLVPATSELAEVELDSMEQDYNITFSHTEYRLGFVFSKTLMEDDKWSLLPGATRMLMKSAMSTRQVLAAQNFNNAATTNLRDGVPMLSLVHPWKDSGSTWSNTFSAGVDATFTSIQDAIYLIENVTDEDGIPKEMVAKTLMTPGADRMDMQEILSSVYRPDNANNISNVFPSENLKYLPFRHLTDKDSWFVFTDKDTHELTWYDRINVSTKSWFDDHREAAYTRVRFRCSDGARTGIGFAGSMGA